jgi:ribosomal-protein-alanine N-acetyltransferase
MSSSQLTSVAMTEADLDSVLAIEREAFPTPWSRENFRFELESNPFARNLVLKDGGQVVAYACLWIVGPELKINNIAVRADRRGMGLGRALLRTALRLAREGGCTDAELEVRPSNATARRLYESHGFREVRRRKGYYQDTHEDAIVMAAKLGEAGGTG